MMKYVFIFMLFLFSLNVGFSIINTIYISSCGINLNQTYTNGDFYELNQSITSLGGNCLNITSDNVSLDCKGFSITGVQTNYGIFVKNSNYLRVNNCNIYNFSTGLYVNSSQYSNYTNIISNNNTARGIRNYPIDSGARVQYNLYENITIENSGSDGFRFEGWYASSNIVRNIISKNNGGKGLRTWSGGSNEFNGFLSENNGDDGVALQAASNNNKLLNGIIKNNVRGLNFYNSRNNYINNVSILNSSIYEINFTTSDPSDSNIYSKDNTFNYTTISNSQLIDGNFNFENNTFINSEFLDSTDKNQVCFPPGLNYICTENLAYIEQSTSNIFPSISVSSLILIFMGVVSFLFFN